MNCCTIKREKKQTLITTLFIFLLSAGLGGLALLVAVLGSLFSRGWKEKKRRVSNFLKVLLHGLSGKMMDQPFLFSSHLRCKISGKIMHISTPLAGAFYKYFNFIVFGLLLISFLGLIQGVKTLGTWMHIF